MNKHIITLLVLFFLTNCDNQTIYSGKILNQESFNNLNYKNKNNLLSELGRPSYIDPITNKFFYFSEKKQKKTIFQKKTDFSLVFVFEFDNEGMILSSKVIDLKNKNNIKFIKEETSSEVIRRGLLEKVFGGVGPQQELPNSP